MCNFENDMIKKLFLSCQHLQNYNSRKIVELKLHILYNILLSYFHLENTYSESVDVTHYLIYSFLKLQLIYRLKRLFQHQYLYQRLPVKFFVSQLPFSLTTRNINQRYDQRTFSGPTGPLFRPTDLSFCATIF